MCVGVWHEDRRYCKVSAERSLSFTTMESQRVSPLPQNRFVNARIGILLHDSSDKMLSFKLRSLTFYIGGVMAEVTGTHEGFCDALS